MFSLLWHWSYSRLDRRAIIIIVLTTLCLIKFTHFSDERCIEVENRGKTHFGVLENVRCSKVYVVKCTFYWGLIYKDKEGKKRELAKMHLIARKTLYWGTLYQGSTVRFSSIGNCISVNPMILMFSWPSSFVLWKLTLIQQAQRRAAADRSRHKSRGRIRYQGPYFPH